MSFLATQEIRREELEAAGFALLWLLQLIEPVLHVAERPQQIKRALLRSARIEGIEIILALIDARLLLGRG